MNKDKYVFAQLIEFLDNNKFRHLVDKYDGNRYVFTAVPNLARIYDGRLCISAYRLDSRRTYPVQTIQANIQFV